MRRVVSFCVPLPNGETTIRSIFVRLARRRPIVCLPAYLSYLVQELHTRSLSYLFSLWIVCTCLVYDVLLADVCVVVGLRVKRQKAIQNMNHVNYNVLMRNILSNSCSYYFSYNVCRSLLYQSLSYSIISFFINTRSHNESWPWPILLWTVVHYRFTNVVSHLLSQKRAVCINKQFQVFLKQVCPACLLLIFWN